MESNDNKVDSNNDNFVGKVDSICCYARSENKLFTFAITTAHSFQNVNHSGWVNKKLYQTNLGAIIYYNKTIDLSIIELVKPPKKHPKFTGKISDALAIQKDDIFTVGKTNIQGIYQTVGNYNRIENCLIYKFVNEKTGYGSSGSYVCSNGFLIGMHLGIDAKLMGCALPFAVINNVLKIRKFEIL
jgi:hypothetical protein